MGVKKCAKSYLIMSKMMILGVLWEGGRGKWVGVAEHTLTNPHVKFEHEITFHRLIFNELFKKNRGGQFRSYILYTYLKS